MGDIGGDATQPVWGLQAAKALTVACEVQVTTDVMYTQAAQLGLCSLSACNGLSPRPSW